MTTLLETCYPCLTRVRRLEAAGFIRGYFAQLDPERLGLGLLAFVTVISSGRHRMSSIASVRRAAARRQSNIPTRAGQVVTHSELLKAGWGQGKLDQQHDVRIYVTGLRRKLEIDPAQPQYLLTETGVRYRLRGEI